MASVWLSTIYLFQIRIRITPYSEMKVRAMRSPAFDPELPRWPWSFPSCSSSIYLTRAPVGKRKLRLMMKARCKWLLSSLSFYGYRRVCPNLVFFTLYSRPFFERRMGQEIGGEVMGENYNGYVFKITGGNDQQGFAMKQGIMRNGRARILFKKSKCDSSPRAKHVGKFCLCFSLISFRYIK